MTREQVIKGLEVCSEHGAWHGLDCELNEAYKDCPYRGCKTGCIVTIAKDALALLKAQETMMQCIKGKCRICPHCSNCDVDEDGLLKEQDAVKPCVAVDTWICPKCGHALESQYLIDDKENPQVLVHEQYNFCPNCGKAVKWE